MKHTYEQCTEELHDIRVDKLAKIKMKLERLRKELEETEKKYKLYKEIEINDEEDY